MEGQMLVQSWVAPEVAAELRARAAAADRSLAAELRRAIRAHLRHAGDDVLLDAGDDLHDGDDLEDEAPASRERSVKTAGEDGRDGCAG